MGRFRNKGCSALRYRRHSNNVIVLVNAFRKMYYPEYLRALLFQGSGFVIRGLIIRPFILERGARDGTFPLDVSHLD